MKTMRITTVLAVLTLAATGRTWAGAPAIPDEATHIWSSKPVAKDGLQVSVTLFKATFAAAEPLKFTVQFTNVSQKPFALTDSDSALSDASWFWDWNIRFENPAGMGGFKGPWQLRLLAKIERIQTSPRICKPGETVAVDVDLGKASNWFDFVWKGEQDQPFTSLKQLRPGKYRLTVEPNLKKGPVAQDVPFWIGTVKTEPVEFEIIPSPTPAR